MRNRARGFGRWAPLSCLAAVTALSQTLQTSASTDVVLVLNQSESMAVSDRNRLLLEALSQFVRELSSEDSAGLVLYGTQAWAVHPLGPLAGGQRAELIALIRQVRYADAQGNLASGIERGFLELKARGRAAVPQVLVLITDAGLRSGDLARDEELKRWLHEQLLPEARRREVQVLGLMLGGKGDFRLVQDLAAQTGGRSFSVPQPAELRAAFQQIAAALPRKPATPAVTGSPAPASAPSQLPAATVAGARRRVWLWAGGCLAAASLVFAAFALARRRTRPARPFSAAPPPVAELVDLRNGKTFSLDKSLVRIGRKPDNDLVIAEGTVSGHHAEIERREGQFFLRDLNSANATKVNDQKVQGEVRLENGDILRFDVFGFTFTEEDNPERTVLRQHGQRPGRTVAR